MTEDRCCQKVRVEMTAKYEAFVDELKRELQVERVLRSNAEDEREQWRKKANVTTNRLCFEFRHAHRCRFKGCRTQSREVYMVNGVHVRLCEEHRDCAFEDLKPIDESRCSACHEPSDPRFGLCMVCIVAISGGM